MVSNDKKLILTIAHASLNLIGQDWPTNLKAIYLAIDKAFEQKAVLLCFGELTLTSPDCADNFQYSDNVKTRQLLQYIADYADSKNLMISIGHPWYFSDKTIQDEFGKDRQKNPLFNRKNKPFVAQSFLANGKIVAMSLKTMAECRGSQRDDRHFQMWQEGITIEECDVLLGCPAFSVEMNGKNMTVAQIIGNMAIQGSTRIPEATLVLNPHAGAPISFINQNIEDQKKITSVFEGFDKNSSDLRILVSTNNMGNGGEHAKNGNRFIAVNGKKITATYFSGFDDVSVSVSAVPLNSTKFSVFVEKESQSEMGDFSLEMHNGALWLFDYLRKSRLHALIMAFSGGFNSAYNAMRVRLMVELVINALGVDHFCDKMGDFYQDCKSLETPEAIKVIMKKMLTCVYFSDDSTTLKELNEVQTFVEKLGASFYHYDIQPEVNKIISLDKRIAELDHYHRVIENTKDRVRTLFVAEMGNLKSGTVGIANANLDKLCENKTIFGGNLQGGQLGLSAHKWRIEQQHDMEKLNQSELDGVSRIDFSQILRRELKKQEDLKLQGKLTSEQTRQIFTLMLKAYSIESNRKNNPIEVFEKCYGTEVFEKESIEQVYLKIKQCYESWAEGQISIHAMPLCADYDYRAIHHENGLRTPNINGFHRDELEQLKLYCDVKEGKISEADEYCVSFMENSPCPPFLHSGESNVSLKIATASCNQTGMDWAWNVKNICVAIDSAVEDDADILCLQELTISGYDCDDYFEYMDNQKIARLVEIIAHYATQKNPNLILSVGHPWRVQEAFLNPAEAGDNRPFNVQSFISGGQVLAMSAKKYLYDYARGHEARHFREWDDSLGENGVIDIEFLGRKIPFGSPIVQARNELQSINLYHVICEEAWIGRESSQAFKQDNPLAKKSRQCDITLAINPNGSPPTVEKWNANRQHAMEGSKYCEAFVHSNFLGTESLSMVGFGTQMVAQNGKIISEAAPLSFKNMSYSSVVIRARTAENNCLNAHVYHHFKQHSDSGKNNQSAPWLKTLEMQLAQEQIYLEMELRNECLWLFDYMRKNNVHGFTQALSGGADSAYNAAKLRLMVQLAIQELGLNGFLDALHYSEEEKKQFTLLWKNSGINPSSENIKDMFNEGIQESIDAIMDNMLTSIYLSTNNNSEETKRAARTLIQGETYKGIGGKYQEYDIQPLIDGFFEKSNDADMFGIKSLSLTNPQHTLVIENLQARMREVIILMMADFENKQSFSNPNLNEAIRGYTTFLGDLHSGYIAPNMHKFKYDQLKQMDLLQKKGLAGIPPVTSFYHILNNKPSAELKPNQFDEDAMKCSYLQNKLMAVEMFGAYSRRNPERKQMPIEVFEALEKMPEFKHCSISDLHEMILTAYKAWPLTQHKLRASPPSTTYSDDHYADHKKSLQTPCIHAYHAPELGQLLLYCIERIAREQKTRFQALTGYALDAFMQHILINKAFAEKLESSLWRDSKRKLEHVYEKMKQDPQFFSELLL
jgi:NAD+ synthase (glutamine-hydrolysing)